MRSLVDWIQGADPSERLAAVGVAISAIALVVAILAMIANHRSVRTANAALKLAREQDRRSAPLLRVRLEDYALLRHPARREYRVEATVMNPSDGANSVVRVELVLHYRVGGQATTLHLPASSGGRESSHALGPFDIAPRASVRQGFRFLIDSTAVPGWDVSRHELVLTDVLGGVYREDFVVVLERDERHP